MNVSRETVLDRMLSELCSAFGIEKCLPGGGFGYKNLTRPALLLLFLSLYHKIKKPLLLLFNNNVSAENLYFDAINLFDSQIYFFPESSAQDVDIAGFNLEVERYRSEAVNALRKGLPGIYVSTNSASQELSVDKELSLQSGFIVKTGVALNRKNLISSLELWGYGVVDRAESPKTFSIRGGILDVFLPYSAHPVRIEFFGETVESMRLFNPRSQRAISKIYNIEILPPPVVDENTPNKETFADIFTGYSLIVTQESDKYTIIDEFCKNIVDAGCLSVVREKNNIDETTLGLKEVLKNKIKNIFLFTGGQKTSDFVKKYKLRSFQEISLPLSACFYSYYANALCLSLSALNKQKPAQRLRWSLDGPSGIPQKEFSSIDEIDWGDHLVHQDFGVGLYRGLEIIETHDGIKQEFIKIEYADKSSVFVPVEKFDRVHRLIFTGNKPPEISSLNNTKWTRQKQFAKAAAQEAVADLVKLYSAKSRKRGFKYAPNDNSMAELQGSFPYEETAGQASAIADVIKDMESDSPVDRLICGDVGFGKTEVALRAALKAIISGKKVLFLTPTTILADQHFISTKGRLDPLGIKIELLSRFKTKKEQHNILELMLTGSVDMVIGTHRLLSQDVSFPNVGLLIIDEEHRFGVKHKERLRKLRETIDVITLTATPIPRTLQHALLGIRDISRIDTPPKTRRPIKTFVRYLDWKNVKNIIDNELSRNGQIYFLHNDIDSIPFVLKRLRDLYPDRVLGVAHGRLNTKDLENTILSFFDGAIDILLCTTIIESGLDVSNANTIIINNAQNFGLSQLYQIRGRVGRGDRQAYCHLLLPKGKVIGASAKKRLQAIEQYTTLGSGYDISLKDLEIRGAGNLFGYKQSGHIAKVGFEMYCKLLQEAVDEKLGLSETEEPPNISIPVDAFIDSDYVPLVQDRLYFYQQLANARSNNDVALVKEELADRFGALPNSAFNLFDLTKIRIGLTGTSVSTVSIIGNELKLRLVDHKPFTSAEELVRNISKEVQLCGYKHAFLNEPDGLELKVETGSIKLGIKLIDLFVKLFSN